MTKYLKNCAIKRVLGIYYFTFEKFLELKKKIGSHIRIRTDVPPYVVNPLKRSKRLRESNIPKKRVSFYLKNIFKESGKVPDKEMLCILK